MMEVQGTGTRRDQQGPGETRRDQVRPAETRRDQEETSRDQERPAGTRCLDQDCIQQDQMCQCRTVEYTEHSSVCTVV